MIQAVRLIALICLPLLAILLQIQITFGRDATSLGFTLNLADLTLPIIGIGVLFTLITGHAQWPRWKKRGIDVFIAVISCYFLFSAAHAYHLSGVLSTWALINRLVGWGIILAYFYLGAFLVTNCGLIVFRPFILSFASFTGIMAGIETFGITLNDLGFYPNWMPDYPLDGAMGNRNAFAFLFLASFGFILTNPDFRTHPSIRWLYFLLLMMCPALLFLNGSRVLVVILPIIVIGLFVFVKAPGWRSNLIPLLMGGFFFLGITFWGQQPFLREHQTERLNVAAITNPTSVKMHASDSVRSLVNHDALDLFINHPVLGVGLGNFLTLQQQKYGHLIDLIDSVPLWILTEMGLVGFCLLGGFGLQILRGTLITLRTSTSPPAAQLFHRGILAMILIFGLMGLVHQLFYARFFWLLLGAAAARIPVQADQNDPSFFNTKQVS